MDTFFLMVIQLRDSEKVPVRNAIVICGDIDRQSEDLKKGVGGVRGGMGRKYILCPRDWLFSA